MNRELTAFTATVALRRHRPAVTLHEALHDGQPEPQSALCPSQQGTGAVLHEQIENAWQNVGTDSDSVIPHPDLDVVTDALSDDDDLAARLCVLRRVGE